MKNQIDWFNLVIIFLLGITSITTLFSIDPVRMPQQALSLLIGIALYLYLSIQDIRIFKTIGVPSYIGAIVILALTLVLGVNIRGSTRWVNILGFQFQPSEFVKPLLVLGFAHFMSVIKPNNLKNVLKNMALFILPFLLVYAQPDLGTSVVVFVIWASMMFVGRTSTLTLALSSFLLAGTALLSPWFLKDYQLERLTSFLDPFKDPLNSGYNVIQSMIAVGSGGVFGKGLGRGTQSHLRFLPEKHTDFVFASLAEEFGLIGSLALLALFALLFMRILESLGKLTDEKGKLIVTGVFAFLFFQTVLNIAMNIGIAPVTGITLPLISFGRSSVLSTCIALGIASSAMRQIRPKPQIELH